MVWVFFGQPGARFPHVPCACIVSGVVSTGVSSLHAQVRARGAISNDGRARDDAGAGLALALIYAAGYVGERVVSVWGKSLKIPTLAGMLLAGLALRNVPGPWRDLLAAPPRDWLSALRTLATVGSCMTRLNTIMPKHVCRCLVQLYHDAGLN